MTRGPRPDAKVFTYDSHNIRAQNVSNASWGLVRVRL